MSSKYNSLVSTAGKDNFMWICVMLNLKTLFIYFGLNISWRMLFSFCFDEKWIPLCLWKNILSFQNKNLITDGFITSDVKSSHASILQCSKPTGLTEDKLLLNFFQTPCSSQCLTFLQGHSCLITQCHYEYGHFCTRRLPLLEAHGGKEAHFI